VGGDVPVDSDVLLMTDFINLKIKLTQSFRDVHIFIHVSDHSNMFFKKST
jgi:hypothetical protein